MCVCVRARVHCWETRFHLFALSPFLIAPLPANLHFGTVLMHNTRPHLVHTCRNSRSCEHHQRNRVTAPGECRCARGAGGRSSDVQSSIFFNAAKLRKTHRRKEKFFTQRDQILKSFVDLCEGASVLFHWCLVR